MSFFEHLFSGGIPGGHFGHHGMGEEENNEPIDTEEFYKRLRVDKNASPKDLKRSYRKLARELHPDRHPQEKEKYRKLFQEVQEAYEVLSDENKRKLYDKGGIELVKRGGRSSGRDPFSSFFGRDNDHGGKKKSPPIKKSLEVTLEELYRGTTREIIIQRKTGEKGSTACTSCDGRGEITVMQRMGPVMFQQRRSCQKCEGNGYMLTESNKKIEFHIPVGGRHGEKVTIPGEGHEYPDHLSGDVIIQLIQKKHSTFTRQGADLGINYKLTLVEALCGYEIKLPHVSGSCLIIRPKCDDYDGNDVNMKDNESNTGYTPVQPGDLKVVYTQGMPQRFNTHVRGNLYIAMEVELPLLKNINSKQLNQLKQILPNTETNEEIKNELESVSGNNSNSNENNSNNNNKEPQLKGFFNKKSKKTSRKSKKNLMDTSDDIVIEEVDCENVDGKPKATPATARGVYDEDDQRRGEYECHQM